MVKYTITKAEYDLMTDEMKGHYLQDRDGNTYSLSTSGTNPVVERLQTQLGEQGTQLAAAQRDLATANHQLTQADEVAEKKYADQLKAATDTVATMRTTAATSARDKIVSDIAGRFKSPELFTAALQGRVKAEYDDKGELKVTCHNEKGDVITQEALTDEYCKHKDYSAMLKQQSTVTMSTPGAAPTPGGFGGGTPPGAAPTPGGSADAVRYGQDGVATYVNFDTATPEQLKAAIGTHVAQQQA